MVTAESAFGQDFLDMIEALIEANVEFLVVGAHALAVHGVPRATGDLDLWVRPSAANAVRVLEALRAFGAQVEAHGVTEQHFETVDQVYQIGLPPRRIDLLTSISGVDFDEAFRARQEVDVGTMKVPFLGREALVRNKRASGREKDLLDVRLLENA